MTRRMLIDATQPEETRVVLTEGNRVEDFDFEVADRKILRSNIYLARIVRVEPSLQAAFVEYGGNRHGFLALNEIHPDYYRIPVEDRQALIEAQEAHAALDPDDPDGDLDDLGEDERADGDGAADQAAGEDNGTGDDAGGAGDGADGQPAVADAAEADAAADARPRRRGRRGPRGRTRTAGETTGRSPGYRSYKIQEVITRRQIMLVQVIKDERGNKGAALSTYLSLAGRYCVLMPNTARGGGVSRKITDSADRKRLRTVVEGLEVPTGMGVIVRTAGSQRTRSEIRRDYDYLLRLWDQIREQTLESTAPCLIHEEANLIRRSIRDLYSRDIEEVLVEGDEAYRTARTFMKTLMPSHVKRIKRFSDSGVPMFHRFQVESQLDAIHTTVVHLPSGGSIVLNQTEALVAIDVNSGRATRERNIEETALKTNLEAASEITRQLRLRDLAGLVVIDFIDMDGARNQHAVERRMKEELKHDRARVQIGRISQFGLMEMSRQRLRPSIAEASTIACPHCEGTGRVRSIDSAALHVLRGIEEEGLKQRASEVLVRLPSEVGFYILNNKRDMLAQMEERHAFVTKLAPDDSLVAPEYRIERVAAKTARERNSALQAIEGEQEAGGDDTAPAADAEQERKPRRRRGRTTRRREEADAASPDAADSAQDAGRDAAEGATETNDEARDDTGAKPRRRRGRRGGRRRAGRDQGEDIAANDGDPAAEGLAESDSPQTPAADVSDAAGADNGAADPARDTGAARDAGDSPAPARADDGAADADPDETPATAKPARKPRKPATRTRRQRVTETPPAAAEPDPAPMAPAMEAGLAAEASDGPAPAPGPATNGRDAGVIDVVAAGDAAGGSAGSRRGWWNRKQS